MLTLNKLEAMKIVLSKLEAMAAIVDTHYMCLLLRDMEYQGIITEEVKESLKKDIYTILRKNVHLDWPNVINHEIEMIYTMPRGIYGNEYLTALIKKRISICKEVIRTLSEEISCQD